MKVLISCKWLLFIKLYQHHVLEKHTHAVDYINVLDVFCSCYNVISAVSQTYVVQTT